MCGSKNAVRPAPINGSIKPIHLPAEKTKNESAAPFIFSGIRRRRRCRFLLMLKKSVPNPPVVAQVLSIPERPALETEAPGRGDGTDSPDAVRAVLWPTRCRRATSTSSSSSSVHGNTKAAVRKSTRRERLAAMVKSKSVLSGDMRFSLLKLCTGYCTFVQPVKRGGQIGPCR